MRSHRLRSFAQPVGLNAPPQYIPRDDRMRETTEGWNNWAQSREIEEWLASAGGVIETGWTEPCVVPLIFVIST